MKTPRKQPTGNYITEFLRNITRIFGLGQIIQIVIQALQAIQNELFFIF
jgi:hypothetical protein